ncbi:uncharacterized protein F4822DRAFT_350068 [Hypoxylon trugodes]|uniref:uncharacterized protein n=1 Tax=Hypoxylon trugodes TaxID=326681 RepID=UPI002191D8CF|nr:uncharacterized protein F4822DRAFT_350068 [Hypoxylon trugodes]KAI1385640.1 hypothetical protein F4822DRAFT_350068 [Hypoxylon trugodes]
MESMSSDAQTGSRAGDKSHRTRALRTYSKRSSSTDVAEPKLKKRRVDNVDAPTISEHKASGKTPETERQPDESKPSAPLHPQPIRKGTIMNYFKVIPSTPNSMPKTILKISSSEPPSESIEPTSTPPSSPPLPDLSRKKRRRLTTRVVSRTTSEDPKSDSIVTEDREDEEPDAAENRSPSPEDEQGVLSDAGLTTLNRPIAKLRTRSDAGKRGQNLKKGVKSATAQTTLSLTNEEKGFTECRECNMLYNPLHKQDAKHHAKQHAAMLKAKSRSNNKETYD